MKEVAKKAGVSIATVSAVVNGNKYVSEELRERTENVIKELNYRPNRSARSLKGKKTNLLGLTVTEITNPYYPALIKGVEELAFEQNYNVILSTTNDEVNKELKLLESMMDQGVDGIILTTVDHKASEVLTLVEKAGIPHVLINRAPENYEGSCVYVNSVKVGEIATNHLVSLGHKRIAFVSGRRQNSSDREVGFRNVMAENGLQADEELIVDGNYDEDRTYKLAMSLLQLPKEKRPTAVFAASDSMAFAVARACLDQNMSIPGDLSIIGSDNVPFSSDFRVPLTTVDVKADRIGKIGFSFLEEMMTNPQEFIHKKEKIEPSLVVRQSTGPL
ncbi:LacI family DNA-binding transcriptional regulator [Shouchella shacheensis]|uniref:LacI family DNA-binding transcriptional regulator n=1 Tax=Shouchella shacheensis TaxID=1649580 RepID=UPI00073FAD09|nr:LacI family DNA-binding transcriptional regulator [Shouchella shacheensis]